MDVVDVDYLDIWGPDGQITDRAWSALVSEVI
jgi:hypothetical protein